MKNNRWRCHTWCKAIWKVSQPPFPYNTYVAENEINVGRDDDAGTSGITKQEQLRRHFSEYDINADSCQYELCVSECYETGFSVDSGGCEFVSMPVDAIPFPRSLFHFFTRTDNKFKQYIFKIKYSKIKNWTG